MINRFHCIIINRLCVFVPQTHHSTFQIFDKKLKKCLDFFLKWEISNQPKEKKNPLLLDIIIIWLCGVSEWIGEKQIDYKFKNKKKISIVFSKNCPSMIWWRWWRWRQHLPKAYQSIGNFFSSSFWINLWKKI